MTERQQLAIAMRESMAAAPVVPVVPSAPMDGKENSPPPTVRPTPRPRAPTRTHENSKIPHADDGTGNAPRTVVSRPSTARLS